MDKDVMMEKDVDIINVGDKYEIYIDLLNVQIRFHILKWKVNLKSHK